MFRIVCMVEDKNLHKVLHAVAGLVANMEPPQPVTNALVVKGKVREVSQATSKQELFIEQLAKHHGETVTTTNMREMMIATGGHPSSINNLLSKLVEEKALKRKSKGIYMVTAK